MAVYKNLGSRTATGTNESGDGINWLITFDQSVLNVSTTIPSFEIYKMIVNGAPGSSFNVMVESWLWDTSVYGAQNSWDPSQPLVLQSGQTLYFDYTYPSASDIPPTATVWLRYDMEQMKTVL